MKILILDDEKIRHDIFAKQYHDGDVIHVYKFNDFLKELEGNSPFDLIHLDHDLGDFVNDPDYWVDGWGKKREFNGQNAAYAVIDLPEEKLPKQVIVHSINSVGAPIMVQTLKDKGLEAKWEPFTYPV